MPSPAILAALEPRHIADEADRVDLGSWPDELIVEAAAAVMSSPGGALPIPSSCTLRSSSWLDAPC